MQPRDRRSKTAALSLTPFATTLFAMTLFATTALLAAVRSSPGTTDRRASIRAAAPERGEAELAPDVVLR